MNSLLFTLFIRYVKLNETKLSLLKSYNQTNTRIEANDRN